jgi:endonuclease/exonuclease/phosphatase family metal-dependent hydrolase
VKKRLRIATLNFLAGGSARRSAHWSMLRTQLVPDLLLTQESKPPPSAAGAHATALWTEAVRGWGTGLYARKLAVRPVEVEGFRGWITGGELLARGGSARPTRVFSVHCPPGKRGYVHTVHEILDRFQAMTDDANLIVGGDFNVAVGVRGPDELVKMSKAERALMTRFTNELDLIPCWQAAHPIEPLAQTLRWSGNRAAPYHCDGIFIPRAWQHRLESCEVIAGPEWEQLSDHNPVLAVLRR